ncbi:MAG: PAS domain S-box protein, partial [Proteobacteria bacterium]|nr:PAS domain S-box protein [Pseudomonadota bacterium]
LIGDTLTKEGHEIYTAERGSEALKIIAKSPLDMLITDIKMPEMGGIQLIEEAKGIIPEILIIVITGYPEFNSALKSLKKRVYDYIVKPIDPDVVIATVNRGWERQRLAVKNRQLILDLKQANEELQAAKAYAEGIITNFLDTLIVTDREAKIETVNPETCHLLGYTVEELIGQPVRDIFAEEEEEVGRVFQFFREHENGKAKALRPQDTIRNRELTYRTKGGRLIPMSFNASVITDESGNIMGVVAGAKDITDLKLKEAEIRRERNFSENIIATIPDSLLVVDKDLRVKKANLSFHNVFGLEPEKVIGARITDILGDEDGRLSTELTGLFGTEAMLEDFEFHYEQGKPGERACPPCESARRGGRVLNIRARNIIIAEEELIVMSDITRHKRADEAVQLLNAELERSNRD